MAGTSTAVWWVLQYPVNSDVGWWLHVSGSMLAGDQLYRDVLEVNPPLVGYISMVPHWISSALSLPVTRSSQFMSLAIVLTMITAASSFVRRAGDGRLTGILALGLIATLVGLVGFDLGQREHLLTTLVLPMIAIKWLRVQGSPVSSGKAILAGLAAAIGIAIKPHFVIVWLCVEVLAAAQSRRKGIRTILRSESVAIAALLVVYWTLVVVQGDYPRFLTRTSGVYFAFAAKDRLGLVISFHTLVLVVCALTAVLRTGPRVELARLFSAAGVGSWISMLIQAKGWSYHIYPILAFSLVAALILTYDFAESTWWNPRQTKISDGGLIVLVITLSFLAVDDWGNYHKYFLTTKAEEISTQVEFLALRGPNPSFVMFSDLVSDGFPMVNYSDATWTSPFPAIWWLRSIYTISSRTATESIEVTPEFMEAESFLVQAFVADFLAGRPGTVFVDTTRHERFGQESFPYIEYLSQNEDFRAAWREYVPDGSLGRYAVWSRRNWGSAIEPMTRKPNAP